jgi:IclR family transcriptional regulator, pca regulon regulatory protein
MIARRKATAGNRVKKAAAETKKSSVLSLGKALRLLEAVAASETDMTLSEIAGASNLDPGTTHRMLNTLVDLGYMSRDERKRFTLTLKVLDLGFRAIGRREMRTLARPILRSLVDEFSEAASLGVLNGGDVLYVERIRAGITRLGVDIRVGTLIPAASSVIGWGMLAFLPDAELERVLHQTPRQRGFPEVSRSVDLPKQLLAIRKQGYALSPSQFTNGLTVLAVPVRDEDGYPMAGMSVAAPTIRMKAEELRSKALNSLMSAAKQLARGLAASGGAVAG